MFAIFRDVLCRGAAAEGSQGQDRGPRRGSRAGVEAGSAPPLDHISEILRPEGARRILSRFCFLRTPSGCGSSLQSLTRGSALKRLPLATFFHAFSVFLVCSHVAVSSAASVVAQRQTYPKEIRGYKVERAAVELKSTAETKKPSKVDKSSAGGQDSASSSTRDDSSSNPASTASSNAGSDVDQLITFGSPSIARVTPLGITFNVPVVVAPIKQSGHVDFLLFEDMMVNEHSVEIDEYHRAFDLPTKKPLTLREPLRFFIYTPVAALAAVGEWSNSRETWPVTGRVYVCGKYKKFLFSFKRCVPVELNLTMRNPLRGQ